MKSKKVIAALCAAAVVLTSAGGLPIGTELTLFEPIAASAEITAPTDTLTRELTGRTGTSYDTWTYTSDVTNVTYKGYSAGGNDSIQIRTNNNNSGIVSTSSDKNVKKVTVAWNSSTSNGRVLQIYGSNTAYSSPADLYNSDSRGKMLGTIVKGSSTELTVSGNYKFIGIRSENAALYLDSVSFEYESDTPATVAVTNVSLDKTDAQSISIDGTVEFNASITPTTATDKTVKWSVSGTNSDSIKLYSDADCTTEVGTDATNTLKVYAKGISAGTATVTVTSNADSTKSASCDVTVNAAAADPAYTVTIPAEVTLGGTPATVSVTDVANIPSGKNLVVTMTGSGTGGAFTVTNSGDSLNYTVTKDSTNIAAGGTIISTTTAVNATLTFNAPEAEPQYAGEYKGTVTFNVSIS